MQNATHETTQRKVGDAQLKVGDAQLKAGIERRASEHDVLRQQSQELSHQHGQYRADASLRSPDNFSSSVNTSPPYRYDDYRWANNTSIPFSSEGPQEPIPFSFEEIHTLIKHPYEEFHASMQSPFARLHESMPSSSQRPQESMPSSSADLQESILFPFEKLHELMPSSSEGLDKLMQSPFGDLDELMPSSFGDVHAQPHEQFAPPAPHESRARKKGTQGESTGRTEDAESDKQAPGNSELTKDQQRHLKRKKNREEMKEYFRKHHGIEVPDTYHINGVKYTSDTFERLTYIAIHIRNRQREEARMGGVPEEQWPRDISYLAKQVPVQPIYRANQHKITFALAKAKEFKRDPNNYASEGEESTRRTENAESDKRDPGYSRLIERQQYLERQEMMKDLKKYYQEHHGIRVPYRYIINGVTHVSNSLDNTTRIAIYIRNEVREAARQGGKPEELWPRDISYLARPSKGSIGVSRNSSLAGPSMMRRGGNQYTGMIALDKAKEYVENRDNYISDGE